VEGLRYIAASMMVYAVALALGEFELYRRPWFMPAVAAALNGMVGFVYQSAAGWGRGSEVGFATEMVLTYGTVCLYRQAFDLWEKYRPGGEIALPQMAGAATLAATLMITLTRVSVAGESSLGRVLCVPVVLIAPLALRLLRLDFGAVAGVLCGSMANPMALDYANDTIEGDNPSVSYATVYPVCMFLRVIIIQIVLMLTL